MPPLHTDYSVGWMKTHQYAYKEPLSPPPLPGARVFTVTIPSFPGLYPMTITIHKVK